jgi:Flp pilus assembly protein TadB
MKKSERVSAVMPKGLLDRYKQQLIYANSNAVPRIYVGESILISIILGIIAFFAASIILATSLIFSILIAAIVFSGIFVFSYIRLVLAADKRAKQIESMLPDALQLVSANIRAGMTIDKALWLCARPEFGPFEKELRRMASETLGGKPISNSLKDSTKRVNSIVLERAMRLIIQGIELGGELARLLTEVAHDVRTNEALKKEINAATAMYTLFIIFASVIAAPLLFAVSTFYIQTTETMWSERLGDSSSPETGAAGDMEFFAVSSSNITAQDVILFAYACIIITTLFGSLTIGMVRYGAAKRGIRYVPFFVGGGLGVYFIAYTVISSMFGVLTSM